MTPAEFFAKMKVIAAERDKETKHINADELMCALLVRLGYGDGVAVFEDMERWYS